MSTNLSSARVSVNLTSYDFIKTLAAVLMIIDHIGLIFYPDEVWFRIIGRLCVPIWFFFIGYAKTDKIPASYWIAGIVVEISSFVAGQYLIPLNVLFTIIAARLLRQGMVKRALQNPVTLRGMFLILLLAAIPTGEFIQYGTLAFMFVLMGYFVRYWDEVVISISSKYLYLYIFSAFLSFGIMQGAFSTLAAELHILALALGLFGISFLLLNFRPQEYKGLTICFPAPLTAIFRLLGRRTLEIYVLHIVIFQLLGTWYFPDRFPIFELKILSENF